MIRTETAQDIDASASAWVAREDRAPLTPEETSELEAWLAGDARRPGALLRARATWMRTGSAAALGTQYDPATFRSKAGAVSRRRLLTWGGAAAASLAAGVTFVGLQASHTYATERGEIRRVPLPDGSTVMLNTQSRIHVDYGAQQRRVTLVAGEADFTVLTDAARPFVVEAGDKTFTATKAAFRIQKLENAPLDLLVYEGHVDVSRARAADKQTVRLDPHMRSSLPDVRSGMSSTVTPKLVTSDELGRELAWREGRIAFEGNTLAEAATTFARYSDTRIRIDDPELAAEPVTGLFAANDPVGFSRAIAGMFGAEARVSNGIVVIARTDSR